MTISINFQDIIIDILELIWEYKNETDEEKAKKILDDIKLLADEYFGEFIYYYLQKCNNNYIDALKQLCEEELKYFSDYYDSSE